MDKQLFTPIGKKIEKLRRLRGFSQAELADHLKMTRQALSKIEKSDSIEEDKLIRIAEALGVSVEAIETFNEESTIQNIFNEQCSGFNFNCTFNPIDKIVELYERIVQLEREKNDILLEQLNKQSQ